MGLKIERTRPVRIVSRYDMIDTEQMICSIRFYIPDLEPMHPPAPIVTDVFVGWDDDRTCYVVPKTRENCGQTNALTTVLARIGSGQCSDSDRRTGT
eukprot:sb/3478985/